MPTDWPTRTIGEICDIVGGGTPSRSEEKNFGGSIPWVTVKDMNTLEIFDTLEHTNDKAIENSAANLVDEGTILVATRVGLGKIAIARRSLVFNQDLKGLTAKNIDSKFLFYSLLQLTPEIIKNGSGATVQGITQKFLKNLKILVPSLKIQKKIVERLDAIQKAQKLNDRLIEKTDELFQSLLHCELDADGKDWNIIKVGEIFERVTESVLPTKFPDREFKFIGLENIESGTGNIQQIRSTRGALIKSTKTIFKKDDVLYGKLRPYLNKVWLAGFDGICSTDIWVLRANSHLITPFLLASILRQQKIVNKVSETVSGANLPRANKDAFDVMKISLPPLATQKQIVAKLDAVQQYKSQRLAQKTKLKELFDSVLAKSMKGEMD